MNLMKHKMLHFFESGISNIIVNLSVTCIFFLLYAQNTLPVLILVLLLLNIAWVSLYICFSYTANGNALIISEKAKYLFAQLIIFYALSCFFWSPYMSRRFFVMTNILFSIAFLLLNIFSKPLKNVIIQSLYKTGAGISNFNIISKLKAYLSNGNYSMYYQPSVNFSYNKEMCGIIYNSKSRIPQTSRVYMSSKMDTQQDALENAEYNFASINLGDTLANWALPFSYTAEYNKKIPVRQLNNRILKRSLDILISLLVIIFFLSWMVPLIGLLIKLESKGPVFFKQLRSGLNNRSFCCYKFRSMYVNGKSDEQQATKGDSRITGIGAFLRKTSLDEFPQFINVLKGEMSIVGPRPHMLKHTEVYGAQIENYMERLTLKQGLTGWAQIKGYRGETTDIKHMEDRVRYDLWYMENWSLWLDIKIIFLTGMKIFKTEDSAF